MARKPQVRILHLKRMRSLPNDGSRTLCCILSYQGGTFDRLGFVDPGKYPEFDGEAAWVRVHWWSKSNYQVIEQVINAAGEPMPTV